MITLISVYLWPSSGCHPFVLIYREMKRTRYKLTRQSAERLGWICRFVPGRVYADSQGWFWIRDER